MSIQEKIRSLFDKWSQGLHPGGQVYVEYKGEVIFAESFGYANLDDQIKVTEDTVFHVASISKQITCMSILLLHEREQLNIDADIRTYIDDLIAFKEPVTVLDMMNNVSGIRDQWELQIMSGVRILDVITQRDLLELVKRQKSLNFPPRSQYLYSNSNFVLLSEIIKRVTGVDLATFAKENIFAPLGMNCTFFRTKFDQIVSNRAMSYVDCLDGTFLWKPLNYSVDGTTSLHTTAKDFLKWMKEFRQPTICSKETMEMMLQVPTLTSDEKTTYACGIQVADNWCGFQSPKGPIYTHGGADAGYRSTMMTFPELELDIVIFANVENMIPDAAAVAIAQIVLGEEELPPLHEDLYQEKEVDIRPYLKGYTAWEMWLFGELFEKEGEIFFSWSEKTALVKHKKGNVFEVVGAPFDLYMKNGEAFIALPSGMAVKLRKYEPEVFTQEEQTELVGVYYSEEVESHFEIVSCGDKLKLRHKRFGAAYLGQVEAGIYFAPLDHQIQFRLVKEGEKVKGIELFTGRVCGVLFEKRCE